MNDRIYDLLRQAADLAAEERGLNEQEGEELFEQLLNAAEGR